MPLAMTHLAGFGSFASTPLPDPSVRYVGQYAYTFTAPSTSATVATINSGDLTLSGSNKQLVIAVCGELPTIDTLTIDGVRAVMCGADVSQFIQLWSGPRVGSGNVVIVLTNNSAVNESGAVQVWEVVDALPVHQGFCNPAYNAALAVGSSRYIPLGGSTMAAAFNADDTLTFTWTGVTEDADADVGTFRLSSAHTTSPAAETRDTVTATASGGVARAALASAIRADHVGVTGGKVISTNLTNVATSSFGTNTPTLTNHEGAGSFKLVALVEYENNVSITGATFDGVAMTLLGSVINTGVSPNLRIYAFGIDVTQADASGTLTFTLSGSTTDTFAISLYRLYGVGSVGTPGSVQATTGTGASFTVNVSQGGFILGAHIRATDTQTTTWTGLEETVDVDNGAYAKSEAHRWNCAAETGRTIQAVGNATGAHATLAIPFNP
jgi:hypothetical protein